MSKMTAHEWEIAFEQLEDEHKATLSRIEKRLEKFATDYDKYKNRAEHIIEEKQSRISWLEANHERAIACYLKGECEKCSTAPKIIAILEGKEPFSDEKRSRKTTTIGVSFDNGSMFTNEDEYHDQ